LLSKKQTGRNDDSSRPVISAFCFPNFSFCLRHHAADGIAPGALAGAAAQRAELELGSMTEQASNAAFQVSSTALPDLNGSEQVGSGTKQVCKTAPQPERCSRTGVAPVSNFKKTAP
jgi:hypothetical protein